MTHVLAFVCIDYDFSTWVAGSKSVISKDCKRYNIIEMPIISYALAVLLSHFARSLVSHNLAQRIEITDFEPATLVGTKASENQSRPKTRKTQEFVRA